jgi:hypothetical protein
LAQFGSSTRRARQAYRAFVADGLGRSEPDLDGGGLRRSRGVWERIDPMRRGREAWSFDERVLGGSRFVRSVLDQLSNHPVLPHHRLGAEQIVDQLVARLAHTIGRSVAELSSSSKRPGVVQARQAICYLALCHAAVPARRVALRLGVHPTTVVRAAAGGKRALANLSLAPNDLLALVLRPS